jgi:gliding motility-associated-like protein
MKYGLSICVFLNLALCARANAQLCAGSLGDPVVKIDFGSGTAIHGPALGAAITSYTYTAANFPNDGSYTIESTTNTPNTWWTTTDHTGGGYMMVVNASTSITDYFYKKTVNGLCANTTYEFAAWIMNLLKGTDNSTPNITFTIEDVNGTVLGSYNTGNIPVSASAVWTQYGFFFTTPAGIDTVVIRMRNNKVGAAPGNDIALDDITFRACGPTVSSGIQNIEGTSLQVCKGELVSYTLNGEILTGGVYSDPAYQWQMSTDAGMTWNDINGATTISVTVSPVETGTYLYRMAAAESSNIASAACRVASNVISINVLDGPATPTLEIADTVCGNATGSITITSPAGYNYSINGSDYQSAAVFSALPAGNYNVTARNDTSGCISEIVHATVLVGSGTPDAPQAIAAGPDNCADPTGTLTITDSAAEYSFDNGLSWTPNNVSELTPGDYLLRVKNAAGCESAATLAVVPAAIGFPPVPAATVFQPDCLTATGTITISDSQPAYSFDGGITWGTANSMADLSPGTYLLLTKNNLGCVSAPMSATVIAYSNSEPLPVAESPQLFCSYNNATTAAIAISGTTIKWYAAATAGNELPASTLLQDATTYYASQTIDSCESARVAVSVTVLNVSAAIGESQQQFCSTQNPTVALLEASGTTLHWYSSATSSTPLALDMPLIDAATYFCTQTVSGCESQQRLAVTVSIIEPSIAVNNVGHYVCDDENDGIQVIDLSVYEAEITSDTVVFSYYLSNAAAQQELADQKITNPAAYALEEGINTIYVRADSSDKCHLIAKLILTLVGVPEVAIADSLALCPNTALSINAGQNFDTYTWSTGATSAGIFVNQPGDYWVIVSKNHDGVNCSTQKKFTVFLSNPATITTIEIKDWTVSDNTIEVHVSENSVGNYEYSLDGITFQDSNIFDNLEAGIYTVYVRDKNGCGTVNEEIYILNYPKFFTPNSDGINDAWQIKFAFYEPGMLTYIFDRYGKLLKELKYDEAWDGKYNGRELPGTDYWFKVVRSNGKIYRGHFSLKR